MENIDNKTKLLNEIKLESLKNLLENHPMHIATVTNENKPNLAVVSDVKVLDNKTLLLSNNEMIHTPDNVLNNPYVVLTSFNEKWAGVRITGKAKYYIDGKYFELCNELFNNDTATPKGVIIITVTSVEGIAWKFSQIH